MAAKSHANGNQTWYVNNGANNHITSDLSNLEFNEPYQGDNDVKIGNGKGLYISQIGFSTFQTTSNSNLKLSNILYCLKAVTNLLSIQRFCKDNNCWFKLTANNFVVKDNLTGQTLLQGLSRDELCPIQLLLLSRSKAWRLTAFIGVLADSSMWHHRLHT